MALTAASMAAKIEAYVNAVPPATGTADTARRQQQTLLAFCQGIIDEIHQNSELIPITTDSGTAGSGIITGKVG